MCGDYTNFKDCYCDSVVCQLPDEPVAAESHLDMLADGLEKWIGMLRSVVGGDSGARSEIGDELKQPEGAEVSLVDPRIFPDERFSGGGLISLITVLFQNSVIESADETPPRCAL